LYFKAVQKFMFAQHTIFELNGEKRFLNEALQRCYDKVREFSTYRIERMEIPWNGTFVSGYLHLCPGVDVAPLIFYMPGCDITCEGWPNPLRNPAIPVGMHVFSLDGPGLGQSNMRGIRLTSDNFEQAASVVLDALVQLPEIDAEQVVTYGAGAGSFWALRFAALDKRVKAAATKSTYADMYYLMNEEGPRWKQLFAWLTQSATEEELDQVMSEMTLDGYMERIECPTLMVTGEYDLRDPVEEVFQIFDQLQARSELWLFADQFHPLSLTNGPSTAELMLSWLRDRLDGKPMVHDGQVLYIEPEDEGPFANDVKVKRRWYEDSP
jgi:dipeptidyl aminopeptidase/acylaminoacyl peptidase